MSYFVIRPCIIDQHGITPVFPDLNHKRPDFIAYPRKSAMQQPPFVDDDMPPRPFVEDAAAVTEDVFTKFLAKSGLRSFSIDGQTCFDPTHLLRALWREISKLKLPQDEQDNHALRSIVQVATEGRFVGATHICAQKPANIGHQYAIH